MKIHYTAHAIENLQQLPQIIQKRIAKKMRFYASASDQLRFAKRLTNSDEGEWRFRIGEHRVFFDVVKDTIYILSIKDRRDSYE